MKLILLFILCIGIVSAVTIYSGESVEIELDHPYDYYDIIGNSSEVSINITQVGNNVTITPDKYMQNDSFEIVFFDINQEIIIQYSSSGGGGGSSSTKYVYKDIPNYVDREVVKYQDKEVEKIVDKEVEVEKIVNVTPLWAWIVLFLFIGLLVLASISYLRSDSDIDERRSNY